MKPTTGFAWYHREDYPRILDIMADADQLPPTYDDWLDRAESGATQLQTQGYDVVRAVIKPDAFIGWCAVRGLKLDASARARFGSEATEIAIGTRDVMSGRGPGAARKS